jgi:SRSO17 transposase
LPEEEWASEESRREEAGVAEEVAFATKGELARAMLGRAFEAEVPAAWVTAEEVYANDGKLRRWLEGQGVSYVMAVSRSHSLPSIAQTTGVRRRLSPRRPRRRGSGWRLEMGAQGATRLRLG